MQPQQTIALGSTRHDIVFLALSNAYFEQLENSEKTRELVPLLKELRGEIWPKDLPNNYDYRDRIDKRQKAYQGILNRLDSEHPRRFQDFIIEVTKLAHLYEMGGMLARGNFFAEDISAGKQIPHGAGDFILNECKGITIAETVARLNRPILEETFTSHPTNNNTLETMNALRKIAIAATALHKDDNSENAIAFQESIARLAKAKLVPEKNHSVNGETREMLNFLENVYHDLDGTYRHFDRALEQKAELERKAGNGSGIYNPLDLQLQIRFNSWGSSGDKDGNPNVNADTTLEAAYTHTARMSKLLAHDLQKIGNRELDEWQRKLADNTAKLNEIRHEIEYKYRKKEVPLPQAVFDDYSVRLSDLIYDKAALEKAAVHAYASMPGDNEKKHELLMFIRRNRIFGPHMGKLEYRETSEEFSKIMPLLLKHLEQPLEKPYGQMTDKERETLLTKILQTPGKARSLMNAARPEIEREGFGYNFENEPYKKREAIAYHTIKRLELARDHPTLVSNHVLAECEGVSNKLELQLLMEALPNAQGQKPTLGIIPLYEKPETMRRIYEIESDSYANPAYKRHLQEFAAAHPEETINGEPTQQYMIAHSDNFKRGGSSAAGDIDKAHRDARAAGEKAGVHSFPYEGKSESDVSRGGVRSSTALASQFGLCAMNKGTEQGLDMHNNYGTPHSTERKLTRNIAHAAKHYDDPLPKTDLRQDPYSFLAIGALQKTLDDYRENIFRPESIGVILANTGFGQREMGGGNTGTRKQRDPKKIFVEIPVPHAFDYKDKMQFGKVVGATEMWVADPENIRTISFTEGLSHAGVYPTWLGTRTIQESIKGMAAETLEVLKEKKELTPAEVKLQGHLEHTLKRGHITPALVRAIYTYSPTMRSKIDYMAFGIAMSNLETMGELNPKLNNLRVMEALHEEYREAGKLVLSAMNGHNPAVRNSRHATNAVRQEVTSMLRHLEPTIIAKRNTMEFGNFAKRHWLDTHKGQEPPDSLVRDLHCLMDTGFGRFLKGDDQHYAQEELGNLLPGQIPANGLTARGR
jgi:phosphoenolpyruvate carboxylase